MYMGSERIIALIGVFRQLQDWVGAPFASASQFVICVYVVWSVYHEV